MAKSKVKWNGNTEDGRTTSVVWGSNPFTWSDVALAVEIAEVIDGANDTFGIRAGSVPPSTLTVGGEISASGGFLGGTVGSQTTGSYDFPGAIMGYTNIGANSSHGTYTLTTSLAVPNDAMNVVFVAPKSGKVEITVQVLHYDNNTGTQTVYMGLSDAASYNTVGAQHEMVVGRQDENGYNLLVNTFGIEGLTAGNTYQYWLGMKMSIGGSGQSIVWGGTSSNRNPDFMMKAIALPSNANFV